MSEEGLERRDDIWRLFKDRNSSERSNYFNRRAEKEGGFERVLRLLSYTAMSIMKPLTNSTCTESGRELLYFMEDS